MDFYQHCGLVCRFASLRPSLANLQYWVVDSWRHLVFCDIKLFPCAKGFFIVVFTSFEEHDLVMGFLLWVVERFLHFLCFFLGNFFLSLGVMGGFVEVLSRFHSHGIAHQFYVGKFIVKSMGFPFTKLLMGDSLLKWPNLPLLILRR